MKTTPLSMILVLILVLALPGSSQALDKEELKETYQQMSFDDILEIQGQVQELALGSAVETGYVKGSAWGGSGGFYVFRPSGINGNKPAELDNISYLTGGGGGFIVNLDKNWAIGMNFIGGGGVSSKKIGDDYSYYSTGAFMALPYITYRPVILPKFIINANLGVGYMIGSYDIYKTNETSILTEIHRAGTTWPVTVELEARYRILPVWHTGIRVGYLFANINELKRADYTDNSAQALDFSGLYAAIIMGGNF